MVDPEVARARIARRVAASRLARSAHSDRELLQELDSGKGSLGSFVPISFAAPFIRVDTTRGYDPEIEDIVAFVNF